MSTREEMIEDAKADAWAERQGRRVCPTCYVAGGHHAQCPDADEQDATEGAIEDDAEEDTEEDA